MREAMKCPQCCGMLEEGYVHVPRGVYWDSVELSGTFLRRGIIVCVDLDFAKSPRL